RCARSMVPVHAADGSVILDREELPRETSAETLAALPASFEQLGSQGFDGYDEPFDATAARAYPDAPAGRHVHHAGNSSGLADGAGAVLLASEEYARAHGWTPRARVIATAAAGAEPVIMLTAPGPAAEKVARLAGMSLADIDLFEV